MSAVPLILNLHAVDHADAQGQQRQLLDQALAQIGFIPNMYANMVNAPAVLGTYLHGYSLFRSESGLTPAEQEVVFLTISRHNGCDYCTAAHSMLADKLSGVPADALQAIREDRPIPDARLARLHAAVTEMLTSHGRPRPESVQAFLDAGFQEKDLLYIVLAIAVKALSNYSNRLFATELDARFAAYAVS